MKFEENESNQRNEMQNRPGWNLNLERIDVRNASTHFSLRANVSVSRNDKARYKNKCGFLFPFIYDFVLN